MHPRLRLLLARSMIEPTAPGVTPLPAITAPLPELEPYDTDKGLLPQREAQFRQSAATRNNVVAPFALEED